MNLNYKKYKQTVLLALLCFFTIASVAQKETDKWKFQIAFGVGLPENTGFINPFEPKPLNFPTINLGIQHMFTNELGAKLDFGYNRFSNTEETPDFKNNYTRFNVQFLYDATKKFNFLPPRFGLVGHIGPGISFTKPLGSFTENKETFANVLAGLEVHYSINDTVTIYSDFSYALGLGGDKNYNPPSEGFGAFRGDIFTISLGVSVSLSGCYYCD